MSEGSYKEAGRIFEELAAGAARRRIPRAPQIHLQAGNAFIKAGDHEHGIELLRRGLHLMERMGQHHRLASASKRILDGLETSGLTKEHDEMKKEIEQMLSQRGLSLSAVAEQKKPKLPAKCPQCGGTVHPQEVEWIDETTASCDYCGSILEG
jgi:hypothetical protein